MRSTQAWLAFVVAAACAAGLLAFLTATPDQGRRIAARDLGFTNLQRAVVFSRFGHAAQFHRDAHASLLGGRAATVAARSWATALPAGRRTAPAARTIASGGSDAAAGGRVSAFVRWADGIPMRAWRVRTTAPTPIEDTDLAWTVDVQVELSLAQSRTSVRRQLVQVQLDVAGSRPDPAGVPRTWRVVDARPESGGGWLRGYLDPVLVRDGAIDVVAPTGGRSDAEAVARLAATALAPTSMRYVGRRGATTATVWLLDGPAQARAVTGRPSPQAIRSAADQNAAHAIAWVDDRGELLVDLPRLRALDAGAREGVLRHQLVHLALLEHADGAPGLLTEGIALLEAHRRGAATPELPGSSLEPLDAAFSTGRSGIARLLVEPTVLDEGDPLQAAAAAAMAGWLLDERGAASIRDMLAAIDAGGAIEPTLRSTLGLAPRGVERLVAGWTRAQLAPADETAVPADEQEETAQ